ncbi:hypothetical protein EUX98_g8486 [Antrodiella citrinella]|uniref:Uncharacterized protein n=1 Tax=Antrodiella citrinella TaxID=2447956 RepID=A0A4S4M6Q6_9APHY|nr:hypothetical protein EUX98_g8486 [Antrodiella citrinella]
MSSSQRATIFAAALTQVVQWLDFKTFGRVAWYERALLLLREASDTSPSLDDLKLAEARMEVRAALSSRVLAAHPPNAIFEELAMPVTPSGAIIFASELDELDTVTGPDYSAQASKVEEKWAEADALWREKAAPKVIAKPSSRPRPTPKVVAPSDAPSPKVPAKRKGAPLGSEGEDSPPPPARSGTQQVVLSSLFALTSGRIVVGKTPGPKKTAKSSGRPERAVRRRRPIWSMDADSDDEAPRDLDFQEASSPKKESDRAAKRPKAAKAEKEAFPDHDSTAVPSDWFVYRELKKCLKCAASRAPGGVACMMYQGETRCRRCRRTAQGCYWEISPGAIPVSYGGNHKQARDATPASARADSHLPPAAASTLFISHSEAAHPAFHVDDVSYVEEFPSCLAALRRRAALARVHPSSHPASRAIADVVEQSLANAQIQMTTGLMLARSLLRDRAPGFQGTDADPADLEEPLDEDVPGDFTADDDHPVLFHLEPAPLDVSHDRSSESPDASVLPPPVNVESRDPTALAGSRASPDAPRKAPSPDVVTQEADEVTVGSVGEAEDIGEDDADGDEGSGSDEDAAVTTA